MEKGTHGRAQAVHRDPAWLVGGHKDQHAADPERASDCQQLGASDAARRYGADPPCLKGGRGSTAR